MKTFLFIVLVVFSLALPAAQKAYVSDRLEVQMRSGQSTQHKILRMVQAGTPLNVLEQNSQTGYSLVKLEGGEQGWVLSRYLSTEPVARFIVDEVNRKVEALTEENKKLRADLATMRSGKEGVDKTAMQLQGETERLNTEIIAIRQASANALQIQAERDRLQESVINLERELESLRREKNALDFDYRQDWFLIGAGVLFGGIVLGLVLPKISWRKKSSWDSF